MEEKDTFRKLIYICAPDPKLDNFIDDSYDFDADFIIHNENLINQLAAFAYHNHRIPLTFSSSEYNTYDDAKNSVGKQYKIGKSVKDKIVVMGKCEEIWVLTENGVAPSMGSVIDRAKLRHKKILYFKVAKDPEQIFEEVGGIE